MGNKGKTSRMSSQACRSVTTPRLLVVLTMAMLALPACGESATQRPATQVTPSSSTASPSAIEHEFIPEVAGLKLDAARQRLQAAGFASTVTRALSNKPVGTVLAQSPSAGIEIQVGYTVELVVASPSLAKQAVVLKRLAQAWLDDHRDVAEITIGNTKGFEAGRRSFVVIDIANTDGSAVETGIGVMLALAKAAGGMGDSLTADYAGFADPSGVGYWRVSDLVLHQQGLISAAELRRRLRIMER